jgi:hypothetical protein
MPELLTRSCTTAPVTCPGVVVRIEQEEVESVLIWLHTWRSESEFPYDAKANISDDSNPCQR